VYHYGQWLICRKFYPGRACLFVNLPGHLFVFYFEACGKFMRPDGLFVLAEPHGTGIHRDKQFEGLGKKP
jgi:hypothetical protein